MIYKILQQIESLNKIYFVSTLILLTIGSFYISNEIINYFNEKEIKIMNKKASYTAILKNSDTTKIIKNIIEKTTVEDNLKKELISIKDNEILLHEFILFAKKEIKDNEIHWSKIINFVNKSIPGISEVELTKEKIIFKGKSEYISLLKSLNNLENLNPFIWIIYFTYDLEDKYEVHIKYNGELK